MGAAHGLSAPSWKTCLVCTQSDLVDCSRHSGLAPRRGEGSGQRCRAKDVSGEVLDQARTLQNIERLTRQLFDLHDLNGDGLLQMQELVKLNEKIAMLHSGNQVDILEIRQRFEHLFRNKLDPDGNPVLYDKFRLYVLEMLDGQDKDVEAQEMILEQFVAEAQCGRQVNTQDLAVAFNDEDILPSFGSVATEGKREWPGSMRSWLEGKLPKDSYFASLETMNFNPLLLPTLPASATSQLRGHLQGDKQVPLKVRRLPQAYGSCLFAC
eukprot:TRINITY_DN48031_c0_g1_i1.p1 TRINITY_DN48031_c0_g1~~TRINITY_DN48031_c0_g1_i1.p1  ORF type:complete len:267 (-),score=64.28 TRINITY_DN48031_c0_g1_i1:110-910(-)